MTTRNQHAPGRAHDGIEAEIGLIGQTGQLEAQLARVTPGRIGYCGQMLAPQEFIGFAADVEPNGEHGRKDAGCRASPPSTVHTGQHGPAQHQQQRSAQPAPGCAAGCRAASIATAPTADCGVCTCRRRARGGNSQPAAASRRASSGGGGSRRRRSGRAILVQLTSLSRPAAGVAAFEQVVAEDAVFRKAAAQARSKASTS
jgi:hypothetical protein